MLSRFLDFPVEIHSMILAECDLNDQVCLHLTCKHLYSLHHKFGGVRKIPLFQRSQEHLCGASGDAPSRSSNYQHRQVCHFLSKRAALLQKHDPAAEQVQIPSPTATTGFCFSRNRSRGLGQCKTRYWHSLHCECFVPRLHNQLDSWMKSGLSPGDWRFCSHCEKYTLRKKWHNGRCYHGKSKPRKRQREFWTVRKGWHDYRKRRTNMKVGLKNVAMDRLEKRVREGKEKESRGGSTRYTLRSLRPRSEVDSAMARGRSR